MSQKKGTLHKEEPTKPDAFEKACVSGEKKLDQVMGSQCWRGRGQTRMSRERLRLEKKKG